MKRGVAVALVAVFSLVAATSFAQEKTPVVKEREKNQKERIIEGRKSGELTGKETRRLAAEQARIHRDEKKAKADGVVTPAERTKLKREQNRASKDIYRQKHDAQKK